MGKITDYLVDKRGQNADAAFRIAEPFGRHEDICAELEGWIDRQEYTNDNPVTVEGYTAEMISKLAPFMDGVGAYNFLITLRERPENGKRIIAGGFKRK